jgi:hypothetical protein
LGVDLQQSSRKAFTCTQTGSEGPVAKPIDFLQERAVSAADEARLMQRGMAEPGTAKDKEPKSKTERTDLARP